MKIVIDISEKDYLDFMLQYDNGILDEKTPSHRAKIAIANGTPLPKGHGRLIDADALRESINEHRFSDDFCIEHNIDYSINLAMARIVIGDTPTIIEADEERSDSDAVD